MEATGTFLWYCFNIVVYKLILTFKSANKVTVQMEADEQYFKGVLAFDSLNEIPKCDHSNKSDWTVLFPGTISYPVQGSCNLRVPE